MQAVAAMDGVGLLETARASIVEAHSHEYQAGRRLTAALFSAKPAVPDAAGSLPEQGLRRGAWRRSINDEPTYNRRGYH